MTQLAGGDALEYGDGRFEHGFDTFYAIWYPRLLRLAACLEPAWAEEIAQETLARAYANFDRLHQEMPGPWLRTVARNVARDLARFHARVEALPDAYENAMTDPYPGPEDIVLVEDARERVRSALRDVSDVDRELLAMSSVEGVTTADLAAQLRASEGAVRVRLHRARRRLGKSYLARGGNLATLPVLAFIRLGRKTARPIGPAASTVAATLALAGAAVVVGALPAPTTAVPTTTHSVQPLSTATHVTHLARLVRHRATVPIAAGHARPATTTIMPPTGSTTDSPIYTRAEVNDPTKPGQTANVTVAVAGPGGQQWGVGIKDNRTSGPTPICYLTGKTCSSGDGS